MLKHFDINKNGRDFVVGDIHGCFSKLEEKLKAICFDESKDRLFSVGDLVDRGAESELSFKWLNKPWFHAVRGNHEQMAIDAADGMYDAGNYISNGGAWFLAIPPKEKRVYADLFSCLPIALDVKTKDGLIGIVHAECPVADWGDMEDRLKNDYSGELFAQACVWNRDRAKYGDTSIITGVHSVIVGHTPMQTDTYFGNVHYIDTGAVFGRELTIIQIQ